ncbi:MAG: dynamin family protein [Actinomycetota bacterium]
MTEEHTPAVKRGLDILDAAADAARRRNRDDLVERATTAKTRLASPGVTVVVAGEFKQGKSTLVNALLNAPISPVDDDLATTVPLLVRFADPSEASVLQEDPDDAEVVHERGVKPDEIGSWVSEATNPRNHLKVQMARIGLPRRLLSAGLELVDTPGVGGLESAHGRTTMAALPMAEAVLFLTDASQAFTASELTFLRQAIDLCPNVTVVVTKIDLYPEWRRIVEENQRHLTEHGIDVRVLAVSSALRQTAIARSDEQLNAESGYPALVNLLREGVVADAERTALQAAANDVYSIVDQLEAVIESERAILADPDRAAELTRQLEAAKDRADRLRTAASRWHTTLNDGISDLTSDIDHDLRARTRQLLSEVEAAIDAGDPTDMAEELPPMVEQRLMDDIATNYTDLTQRADELAEQVEEHFAGEESELTTGMKIAAPVSALEQAGRLELELAERPGFGANLLTGMRSSYGGVLMFGMMGSVIGLATFGPLSLGAGALMGRKGAKDEKARQLTLRRQQAKQGIRKYVDDVTFRVSKHSRDTLRQVQREIRDTNMERAAELQATAGEALGNAQRTYKTTQAEAQSRLGELDKALDHVRRVRTATSELLERES